MPVCTVRPCQSTSRGRPTLTETSVPRPIRFLSSELPAVSMSPLRQSASVPSVRERTGLSRKTLCAPSVAATESVRGATEAPEQPEATADGRGHLCRPPSFWGSHRSSLHEGRTAATVAITTCAPRNREREKTMTAAEPKALETVNVPEIDAVRRGASTSWFAPATTRIRLPSSRSTSMSICTLRPASSSVAVRAARQPGSRARAVPHD